MNTNQKSKTSLVLLIIALVILALTGSYFSYVQGLSKTAETSNTVQIRETAKKDTTDSNQTPRDPNRYYNDEGGYSFVLPNDWLTSESSDYWDKNNLNKYDNNQLVVLSKISNDDITLNQKQYKGEMFPDMIIIFYQNERDFSEIFWAQVVKLDQNFLPPQTIVETVQKINDFKNKNNNSQNVKDWLNEVLSVQNRNIGKHNFVFIENGGFGHTCDGIVKNQSNNVLEIHIEQGSDNCAEIPMNELSILTSLEF